MKIYEKIIGMILLFIIILFLSVNGLYRHLTDITTDEYSIIMYWTDVGGWGWRGKIYLVKKGFIDKKYWTGWTVSASSKWVSDYEFELSDLSEKKLFHVNDFIND